LRAAQEFAQHERFLPGINVAFIPVANPDEKVKISISKGGQVVLRSKHVTTRSLRLSARKLVDDPEKHVNAVIRREPDAKRFTIQAGKYEIPRSFSRKQIASGVARYVARYDNEDANNYFGNWMHGLSAHQFH